MIRAILFDCFGVLTTNDWNAFREQYLDDPERLTLVTDINHATDRGMLTNDEYIQQLAEITGLPEHELRERIQGKVVLNQQLFDVMAQLKPDYKIGLLSNINSRWVFEHIPEEKCRLFDAMTLSYEEGVTKPDAAIYEIAAQKLGVTPGECVFIDDAQQNVDGAEVVGMQAILHVSTKRTIATLESILDRQLEI